MPVPVFAGFQMPGSEPLPKNHMTNSGETGAPVCAYAVPFPFSMISSSGSGTLTAAPVASTPLRTVRRSKVFLAIGSTVRFRVAGRQRRMRRW